MEIWIQLDGAQVKNPNTDYAFYTLEIVLRTL